MKNLTTPKAILIGFAMLSFAVAINQKSAPMISSAEAAIGLSDHMMISSGLDSIASAIRNKSCN